MKIETLIKTCKNMPTGSSKENLLIQVLSQRGGPPIQNYTNLLVDCEIAPERIKDVLSKIIEGLKNEQS